MFWPDIDGLKSRLTRHGYNAKVLAEMLNATPKDIRAMLCGRIAVAIGPSSHIPAYCPKPERFPIVH